MTFRPPTDSATVDASRGTRLLPTPFLDVSARVTTGSEQGLLGLVFDPQYATNGRFYVTLTDVSGQEELLEFHADPHADVADPTGTVLLAFDHPTQEHNAGMLACCPGSLCAGSRRVWVCRCSLRHFESCAAGA